ncbi:MAG: lamin tail domain-containing protein, partial [Anaerohalosphaera sp.]|nr:lamin tail domain-containing protein [Anaerohalosphaera sp.]
MSRLNYFVSFCVLLLICSGFFSLDAPCLASDQCLSVTGDLNDDCVVNMSDFLILVDQWLDEECTWPNCADVDEMLGVDLADYALIADDWLQQGSPVIINEFMARNDTTRTDEDGHYSDWIELHNISSSSVDLNGWFLTNDSDGSNSWQMPAITIGPGQYLIVYASGKDSSNPAANLHTDFQLGGLGEYLALLWPDRSVAHEYSPQYPLQGEDISYGMTYNDTIDQYVEVFFTTPTPGAANSSSLANLGPKITEAVHLPHEPLNVQHVIVSAKVDQNISGVDSVTLNYRVMYGSEASVEMLDNGIDGDALAGDGIYAAKIAAETALPGEMIRYYITASDTQGFQSRLPLGLDNSGDDQSPQYFGLVVVNPAVTSNLPVLHWFVDNTTASETYGGTHASLYFKGRFYDNIFVRTRGSASRNWPKHKFKFDLFGAVFQYSDQYPPVEEFNLQSYYREMLNSGNTSYMRENMAFQYLNDADVPACNTMHLHVRRNAAYYGLFSFIEQVDDTFLERHGFEPKGALYKSINCCSGTLKPLSLGSYPSYYRKVTDTDQPYNDLYDFTYNINASNPNRFNYVFDNVDLPQVINYMAAQCVMTNHDRLTKNYHVYREPDTLLWHLMPWDMDQSFNIGRYLTEENWKHPFYGNADHTQELSGGVANPNWQNHIYTVIFDNPVTQQMYLRRLRTLMDRFLANDSGHFHQMASTYYDLIHDEADLDNAKWGAGIINNGYNEIANINLPTRRDQLLNVYSSAGLGIIPDSQPDSITLNFGAVDYNPSSGNQDEEYIELINANDYAVDISGYKITGGVDFTFQPGTVIPATSSLYVVPSVSAFRGRSEIPTGGQGLFVQGNFSGHLSSWGETLHLLDTSGILIDAFSYEPDPSGQQRYLRITELMYHPGPSQTTGSYVDDDLEFIELKNIGVDTLDLTGVKMTDGVLFDFSGSGQTEYDTRLIDITDTWKYEQSNTAQPTDWTDTDFGDTNWEQGPALLYVEGSALPAAKNTPLTLGATTYYFRTTFYLDADPSVDTISLNINTVIDDGAIIYLNGTEVLRIGMTTGAVEHITFADRTVGNAIYEGPFVIDTSALVQGSNVIAVEVHQRGSGSSDIVMGLTLDAHITKTASLTPTTLAGGDFLLLVKNIAAFSERYPQAIEKIAGQYSGNLDNGGETIKLEDSTNSTILEFTYNDSWYAITDGSGYSLQVQNADETDRSRWGNKDGWRPSAAVGGSPGIEEPGDIPEDGAVIINEILAHSDVYPNDWIELHNTTGQPINIGGWFLSDSDKDAASLKKFEVPLGTIIQENSYIVFTQDDHFGNDQANGCHTPFALSENGEKVHLLSGASGQATGYYQQQDFGASEVGVSIGRYQKSTGIFNFVAMAI